MYACACACRDNISGACHKGRIENLRLSTCEFMYNACVSICVSHARTYNKVD